MLILHRYMVFPCNHWMAVKTIEFYENECLVYDIQAPLDFFTPEYYAYVDMSRFLGKELKMVCKTQQGEQLRYDSLEQIDVLPPLDEHSKGQRAMIHFTSLYGRLNTPVGLVYAEGVYHLFFAYDPVGHGLYSNIHWGHATSKDLFHWTQETEALFPDQYGSIFSGSGIADTKNILGLAQNGHVPLVLFYTAAGGTTILSEGKPFTICIAYSLNQGRTFIKHKYNPIIPNIMKYNRDPKVVYCSPLQSFVMALYLEENRYCLLSSVDLIEWKMFQSFYLLSTAECPDFYTLNANGDPKQDYWIFSGANDYYYVGKIKNEQFVISQPVKRLHYGQASYAAQVFFNAPEQRKIRISWQADVNTSSFSPYSGQLSIPTEMSLKTLEDDLYLCVQPVREIETLFHDTSSCSSVLFSPEESFLLELSQEALSIQLETAYLEDNILKIHLFGLTIICDMCNNKLIFNNSISPISIKKEKFKIWIILDKNSIELYLDEGEFYLSESIHCDYLLNHLKLIPSCPMTLRSLVVSSLRL